MTPAYSAHLNTDTASHFISTNFSNFWVSVFLLVYQSAIQTKHQNSLLKRITLSTSAYLLVLCIYNFILQFKQITQPLKFEKDELHKQKMINKKIYLQKLDHAF